jgi:hypothetical protein
MRYMRESVCVCVTAFVPRTVIVDVVERPIPQERVAELQGKLHASVGVALRRWRRLKGREGSARVGN